MSSKVSITTEQMILEVDFYNHFAHIFVRKKSRAKPTPTSLFSCICLQNVCMMHKICLSRWKNDHSPYLFLSLVDYVGEKVCN